MNKTNTDSQRGAAASQHDVSDASPVSDTEITVYWRPGCGFCGSLLRQLEHHQIAHRRVNIWDDDDAAAIVRSIARGNETVPTVIVGDIGLVNPSVGQIVHAVEAINARSAG